ncbi:MAG: hypothetical protein IT280_09620 [Ignavibacteria bacterium]|nr:hypothetical protein [Ignavibacteria bacterium]
MIQKNLINILKTLDKTELKEFHNFINSKYFNTNERIVRLFDQIQLLTQGDSADKCSFNPEVLFKKIYGTREYDGKTFRYLLSTLYSLLEKFLAITLIESNETELQKFTIESLIERRLFKLAEKNLTEIEKNIGINQLIQGEYVYHKSDIALLWHQLYFLSNKQDPLIEKRLEQGELQMFSSVVELSHIYQILQRVSHSYNRPLGENIVIEYLKYFDFKKFIKYIEKSEAVGKQISTNYRLQKVIRIYLCFMVTMLDITDEEYFEKMVKLIDQNSALFGKPELQNLHRMLTSCCLRKRKVINEEKYLKKLFEVIKQGVSLDLYTSYTAPYMNVINFLMIFQTALQLEEINWAEEFLKLYGERLSPEYSEDLIAYSFASLLFQKKQFENSISTLAKVKFKLFRLKIPVKTLQLKLLYELGYYEQAFNLVDSFSHFISTNKKISNEEKNNYHDFLIFYREILKTKSTGGKIKYRCRAELQKASMLPDKKWLIKKANEL